MIAHYTADHTGWAAYLAHVERVSMARHALTEGQPKPETVYIGAAHGDEVVGHISLKRQPLLVPASALNNNIATLLTEADGQPLFEMFVQTFAVEDAHRRQGIGRALQQAAIAHTGAAGCYQLRSWSSVDARANYLLKLSMGFAASPALYPMPGSAPISGVYFVLVVRQNHQQ